MYNDNVVVNLQGSIHNLGVKMDYKGTITMFVKEGVTRVLWMYVTTTNNHLIKS